MGLFKKIQVFYVLAQNLFDDCFKITDGPDAPYTDIVEMENELILKKSKISEIQNRKSEVLKTENGRINNRLIRRTTNLPEVLACLG